MPRIRASNIEEHKELTRHQLLDATRQLLAEVGYEILTMGDIAAAVGIGRTTIYQYFRDKEDVLASLVEDTLPQVVEDIIASVPEDLPVEGRLTALAEATVGFVASDPVLGLVLHRDVSKLSESTQERISGAHRDLSAEIARLYTVGVEEGRFRALPPRLVGRFIQDLIMSSARALVDAPDPAFGGGRDHRRHGGFPALRALGAVTRTVFTGGSVFDGTGHPPSPGDVVIEDGLVVDVGSGLDGDEQVDCSGRTILPGLFDTHVHFMISGIDMWGMLQTPLSYRFFQAAGNLEATLAVGITTAPRRRRRRRRAAQGGGGRAASRPADAGVDRNAQPDRRARRSLAGLRGHRSTLPCLAG